MEAFGRTDLHAVFVDIEKENGSEEEIKSFGKGKAKEIAAKNYFVDQEQLDKEKTCEKMKQEIGKLVAWSDFKILRFNNMNE